MSTLTDNGNKSMVHCLGIKAIQSINTYTTDKLKKYEEDFLWLQEILSECKRTFAKPEVELLPKTPSAKRAKRRVKRKQEEEDDVFENTAPKRISDQENIPEGAMKTPPKRSYRTRAASRTVTTTTDCGKPKGSKGSSKTRNTRANKATAPPIPSPVCCIEANLCEESPVNKNAKSVNFTTQKEISTPMNVQVKSPVYDKTPVNINDKTPVCTGTPVNQGSSISKTKIMSPYNKNNGQGHVKNKITTYEGLIEANSPTPKSEKTQSREDQNVPETPEQVENSPITPATTKRNNILSPRSDNKSYVKNSPVQCLNESYKQDTPKNARRSTRRSIRKSLKMLASDSKLKSDTALRVNPVVLSQSLLVASPNHIVDKENTQPMDTSELIADSQSTPEVASTKKATRTRLRLKKKGIKSEQNSELDTTSQSEMEDNMDTEIATQDDEKMSGKRSSVKSSEKQIESEEDVKTNIKSSTRTKTRKGVSQSSTSSDVDPEKQTVSRSTRTKVRKAQQQTSSVTSESDTDAQEGSSEHNSGEEESVQQVVKSTRTKTRKLLQADSNSCNSDSGAESTKAIRASTRTKQRKSTTSSAVCSASDETESEEDSGIHCSKLSTEKPARFTRSKMRPPKSQTSVSSVSSDAGSEKEENFVVPDIPPSKSTRTKSRKRQLDDEDDEANTSLSKRSCTEEISSLNTTYETVGKHDETSSDHEMETDSPVFNSPACPSDKIVRPMSFLHNLSNKVYAKPMSAGPKIVKSFIQRNTPPQKLTLMEKQQQKKKDLQEKQKKEQQRLQKRDELLKIRIEEQRKKREERMKKVAELREQKTKQELEQKNKLAKKMEEKRQITENLKEERLKEEKERQKIRMKKQMEIEEKKKQEEEERLKKLKEKEDEVRQYQELQLKRREQEEQERQKRIADEIRRQKEQQERYAMIEKERWEERERMKKLEEEKEQERMKQKEEREKQLAKEKAEKDKQDAERKKERDLQIKKGMEKIKELEKARLQEEQKRREELREREQAIKDMINKHNTALANAVNGSSTQSGLPKPNLNTTQTLNTSSEQRPHNPDSYEMTPGKRIKVPSTFENYDISDIKSDDSTDDEDAPRKRIPPWASGPILKSSLINQHFNPPDLDLLFDTILPPDLNELFVKKKARFNKRTSSAHWDSPILKPGAMLHYNHY